MSGIYVHLPFCPYICPYCDFAKWPLRRTLASRYTTALFAEIERSEAFAARTVFIGGGTPNTYDPEIITELLARLRDRFGTPLETTMEVNPELVRAGDCERYVAAGIDRISIGVQSFDDAEIRTLGRGHTPQDVARVVTFARAAGVRAISLDLIFAIPGQTERSWEATLKRALALEPDHISTYGLTVEEGTPFADWRDAQPAAFFDDGAEAQLYALAIELLGSAGYDHYEVSNFAKPGFACLHNENYWKNGEYVGFGVGAASYRAGERSVNTKSLTQYLEALESRGKIPGEREKLQGVARAGEAVMLALRTSTGVIFSEFTDRYGFNFLSLYEPVVREFTQAGLLEVDERRAWLTPRGRFLANDVCGAFVTFK